MKTFEETFGDIIKSTPKEDRLLNQWNGMISSKIIQKRLDRGMSQSELANELGISVKALSKLENGDYCITMRQLSKICVVLNLKLEIT